MSVNCRLPPAFVSPTTRQPELPAQGQLILLSLTTGAHAYRQFRDCFQAFLYLTYSKWLNTAINHVLQDSPWKATLWQRPKNSRIATGETEMKICENTRQSSKGQKGIVSIGTQGHGWQQWNWKALRDELFIYIVTRRPVLWQQEDGNKSTACHVPCLLLLSHQEDRDTQKEEPWTMGSTPAGDL